MYSDGYTLAKAATWQRPAGLELQWEDTMQYLKDLIERFGKALRIKSPSKTPESAPTNQLGLVHGPVRNPQRT
jgi:hypothetical protein